MKKIFLLFLAVSVLLTSCSQNKKSEEDGLVITDISGKQVEIPNSVERIAGLSTANVLMLYMLDGANKIIATTQPPSTLPWYMFLSPDVSDVPILINRDTDIVNIEELISLSPDIVISENEMQIEQIRSSGLATVYVDRKNFENIKQSIVLTSVLLGNGSESIANDYVSYLDDKINLISSLTGKLEDSEKPRIFVSRSSQSPDSRFVTYGKDTIVDEWIELCGGINVMSDVIVGSMEINIEEFISSNPDIIIIRGSNAHGKNGGERIRNEFLNDPALSEVEAIKRGNVYLSPIGFEFWATQAIEIALQIQWASKLFHPELFNDVDIIYEAKAFYSSFFNIDFSDGDIERMLLQLSPGEPLL